MRLLIQRVSSASVTVGNKVVGNIEKGLLVFAGFKVLDDIIVINRLSDKCLNLRIFEDDAGKMNLSALDIKAEILIISQFTLYANCKKGRRPGFDLSMPPDEAEKMYDILIDEFSSSGLNIQTGIFGAKMDIALVNDGPVTIMLDDNEL
ncbi:MAG: D-aminoacyl-tRNA deacylase [Candidatus Zixiibacteriota bacterium]